MLHQPNPTQVRQKFTEFSGHELACVAWSLRRFGYTTEDNAVFYLLEKQQQFVAADFEILANAKLLKQVLGWKGGAGAPAIGADGAAGGAAGAEGGYSP